jgi:DNA-binding NarL/FixJ family response regulator
MLIPISALLVDADARFRKFIRDLLLFSGEVSVIGEQGTGEAGLREARRCKPQVVVLDVELPDLNGVEFLRLLKHARPEQRALVVTSVTAPAVIGAALEAGADGYREKREAPGRVHAAVKEVVAGGKPLSAWACRVVVERLQERDPGAPLRTRLSPRELQVLHLIAEGLSYKLIADRLGVASGTVQTTVHHILQKLDVPTQAAAVARVFGGNGPGEGVKGKGGRLNRELPGAAKPQPNWWKR